MPTLEVRDIEMEFPAVKALDRVSLRVEPGEVHGIVGENGAGKSTLMRILAGLQVPTAGEIILDERPVRLHGVADAQGRGIAMIHQELNLVDDLTAAENVFLGREITRAGLVDRNAMERETARHLAAVGASFPPHVRVADLSIAGKQLVEIAKALAADASILIMDEPTAVLSEPESEALFRLIRSLQSRGVTILYISHRLAEVCAICDRITVLRDGKWVTTVPADQASPGDLANSMVGRPLSDMFLPKAAVNTLALPRLEVRHLTVPGHARDVNFFVWPGEILGLAGLVGSGRTECAEAIVGLRRKASAEILVDGRSHAIRSPQDARRAGIAYVSEDRKGLGLHVSLSVIHNVTMANLSEYGAVLLNQARERAACERWRGELDIRAGDVDAPIMHLSGGNQQKVALAKWLDTAPRVLILDEPTRGVDVGAKREMYRLIHELAAQGMSCIVISSEMAEIIGLCHRVVVLREGRVMGELDGEDITEEAIMHLAAGVAAP